ncbi:hypothetical protein [Flavobacterium sp. GP15]|uniref:hypothetical protein n=1 Tax=Flavobacterium sp. GP15 TaxID=2758567 RepID=UPI00165D5C55|nr:hypothetical protein [Flavobacterium sp. GP15]
MYFKIIFFFFFAIFLTSCDPAHSIYLLNNTNDEAKVKFNLNSKIPNYRLNEISKDSIVFNIKQKDTAEIYFGIGTWNENEIDEMSNSIKNIEIETKNIKTVYKSKTSINNLLNKKKEGFWWKTKIIIEIN